MRRVLGFVLVVGLMVGGVACGSDSDGGKASDTTAASTNDGGDSGNSDVAAYCKAVDAYVKKAKDVGTDADKAAELATEGQDLATKAGALATAGLSSDDAKTVADCTKKSTDALMPG